MAYQLVLFDFDGTLADSFPWFLSVFNQVARKYHFREIASDEVETFRGYGSRELVRYLGIPWWKLPFIARHLRRLAIEETGVRPFEGVSEMLETLSRKGIEIGIVSSNTERKVRDVIGMGSAGFVRYFECQVGMFAKRSALRRMLARSGAAASKTLYVADETRDAEASRDVGIAFGAVSWGFAKPEILLSRGARHVFQSPQQIGEIEPV